MVETVKIYLKWTYTPGDFFEVKETNLLPDYEHTIEDGRVIVVMDLNEYQTLPGILDHLNDLLLTIFRGAALVTQKPFTLTSTGQEIIHPGGQNEVILQLGTSSHKNIGQKIDLISKDPSGNVITDTKLDRVKKRERFSKLSAKYKNSDPVVESILISFEKSQNNPNVELVHLYEIRDALKKKFNGGGAAKKELGISNSKWERLGILADTLPLNQGRHSGQHIGLLRDATESELQEARDIAVEMVIAYLEYKEKNAAPSP